MRVQALNTYHHTDGLQQLIVSLVRHLRHLPSVALQHLHHRRQQCRHIRHARLDAFAYKPPFAVNLAILRDVEVLSIRVSQPREHLEHEEVASHRHLTARHRREFHHLEHLFLSQIVHHIAAGALKLTFHAVVWVHAYFPKLQCPVQHRLQAFVVIIHRVAADVLRLHACIYLVLSERYILLAQPHIEAVNIFRREMLPSRQLPIIHQLIDERLVTLFRCRRDVRRRCHILDPLNQRGLAIVVGSHIPHLATDCNHVDRSALVQAQIHLFLYQSHDGC